MPNDKHGTHLGECKKWLAQCSMFQLSLVALPTPRSVQGGGLTPRQNIDQNSRLLDESSKFHQVRAQLLPPLTPPPPTAHLPLGGAPKRPASAADDFHPRSSSGRTFAIQTRSSLVGAHWWFMAFWVRLIVYESGLLDATVVVKLARPVYLTVLRECWACHPALISCDAGSLCLASVWSTSLSMPPALFKQLV